jgi:hypothetical protein
MSIRNKMIWLIPNIKRGGKLDLMKFPIGRVSAQSKFKKPNISIFYNVESMAVGVETNRIMKIVNACRIIRLKINSPRLDPPIFFHIISIGSLARFINRTSSLICASYC